MRMAVVVGNPRPKSRTLQIAHAVADELSRATGVDDLLTVDLADHAPHLFQWPNDELAELSDAVAACELLVVASPTYKASYTGLLKSFFDRYPSNALTGVVAVPVMTAGEREHALAVEVHLRPLLVELGASVPSRGLAFNMSRMAELTDVVSDWASEWLVPALRLPINARGVQ